MIQICFYTDRQGQRWTEKPTMFLVTRKPYKCPSSVKDKCNDGLKSLRCSLLGAEKYKYKKYKWASSVNDRSSDELKLLRCHVLLENNKLLRRMI